MNKFFTSQLLLLAVLFIVGCSKEEDAPQEDPCENKSNTELLSRVAWKVSSVTVDPPIDTIIGNIPLQISDITFLVLAEDCRADDELIFMSNGQGTADEGASKCDPTDPQTTDFFWSWGAGETTLTIIQEGDTTGFTEVAVACAKLKGRSTATVEGFEKYEPIFEFVPANQ